MRSIISKLWRGESRYVLTVNELDLRSGLALERKVLKIEELKARDDMKPLLGLALERNVYGLKSSRRYKTSTWSSAREKSVKDRYFRYGIESSRQHKTSTRSSVREKSVKDKHEIESSRTQSPEQRYSSSSNPLSEGVPVR